MNLQELQTIVYNKLPIKIFVFNNGGYKAIVQTHTNVFGRLTGCTDTTGIQMPSFERVAYAYDIPYIKCTNNEKLESILDDFLKDDCYGICELVEDREQLIDPKLMSKLLNNGLFKTPPIDDLAPFLDDETYERYSIINKTGREKR